MEGTRHHQLLMAVTGSNLEEFQNLVANDPGLLNALSPQKNTALHDAARLGKESLVQEIFRRKTKFLVLKNLKGDTPMHVAARAGHNNVIDSLIHCARIIDVETTLQNVTDIEIGRNVQKVLRMTDNEGNTPLHGAVLNRRVGVVEILVREDSGLISLTNKAGESPLSVAVAIKASDILQKILRRHMSSSLLYMGCGGQTLLHGTIIRHDLASMNIVLERYPELVSKKDINRRSPLHYAAALGYVEMVVEQLLDASLAYQGDLTGRTPVHMAAEYGHVTVLARLLDGFPDSKELLDGKGRNVLHLAAQNGNIHTVNYILNLPEMEDLVNAPDKDGYTPLHLSAMNLHSEVVRVLSQDPRVDIRAINHYERSVLERTERLVDLQVSSMNGEAERTIGNDNVTQEIADTVTQEIADDATLMELRKQLTLKELNKARASRAQYLEQILESRYLKKPTQKQ